MDPCPTILQINSGKVQPLFPCAAQQAAAPILPHQREGPKPDSRPPPSTNPFSVPHAPACCTSPVSAAPPRGRRPPPHMYTQRRPGEWPRLHTGPSPCRQPRARGGVEGSPPRPPCCRQAAAAAYAGCGSAARRGSARGRTRPGGEGSSDGVSSKAQAEERVRCNGPPLKSHTNHTCLEHIQPKPSAVALTCRSLHMQPLPAPQHCPWVESHAHAWTWSALRARRRRPTYTHAWGHAGGR